MRIGFVGVMLFLGGCLFLEPAPSTADTPECTKHGDCTNGLCRNEKCVSPAQVCAARPMNLPRGACTLGLAYFDADTGVCIPEACPGSCDDNEICNRPIVDNNNPDPNNNPNNNPDPTCPNAWTHEHCGPCDSEGASPAPACDREEICVEGERCQFIPCRFAFAGRDTDCDNNAEGTICHLNGYRDDNNSPGSGYCRPPCTDSNDCSLILMGAVNYICDSNENRCVECLTDNDCAGDSLCNEGVCRSR